MCGWDPLNNDLWTGAGGCASDASAAGNADDDNGGGSIDDDDGDAAATSLFPQFRPV